MPDPLHILVIEDDPGVSGQLQAGLGRAGMDVRTAGSIGAAEAALAAMTFDLVLLDIGLPDGRGDALLDTIALRSGTPVIVLSARTDPKTRAGVLGAGAVDYVPKPFWMEELVERIRLRVGRTGPRTWALGDLEVNPDAGTVMRQDLEVALSPSERSILLALGRQPGRVVSRSRLAEVLESGDGPPTDRSVDSYVARLRKKLGPAAAARIRTVLGLGYRLDPS